MVIQFKLFMVFSFLWFVDFCLFAISLHSPNGSGLWKTVEIPTGPVTWAHNGTLGMRQFLDCFTVPYRQAFATTLGLCGSLGNSSLPLQWRHNGRDGVWNHQPHNCLPNRLFCFQRACVIKRSCFKRNLMSVCTLTQSNAGTSCGLTNIKSNLNMSRSDWKCTPVHKYWLNKSKWTFST